MPDAPNAFTLPTDSDIKSLPRWACVAFAARCARRTLPIVRGMWPDVPESVMKSLDAAIAIAEHGHVTPLEARVAQGQADRAGLAVINEVVASGARNSSGRQRWDGSEFMTLRGLTNAPGTAAGAVYAAINHKFIAENPNDAGPDSECYCLTTIGTSLPSTVLQKFPSLAEAVRRDFDLVFTRARLEQWTDDTRVPPDFFGPLWPDGEPNGWPWPMKSEDSLSVDESAADPELGRPLSLYFDTNDFSPEEISQVIRRLSALYKSVGGDELVIDDVCVLDPESALMPAGGDS